jgi:hypothetical protein
MGARRFVLCTVIASFLMLASCATSPEDEHRRQEMEADIDEILSYELDKAEYGEPGNCLSGHEYRSYRALGDRHLLFEGRNDKQWVNVLRGRCPALDDNSKFIMWQNMSGRLCDKDHFSVLDPFDSLASANMTRLCILGVFKPVTKAQVKEIEYRLEMR